MAADLALYTTVISLLAGIWLLLRVFPTTALKFRRGFAALKSRLRQTANSEDRLAGLPPLDSSTPTPLHAPAPLAFDPNAPLQLPPELLAQINATTSLLSGALPEPGTEQQLLQQQAAETPFGASGPHFGFLPNQAGYFPGLDQTLLGTSTGAGSRGARSRSRSLRSEPASAAGQSTGSSAAAVLGAAIRQISTRPGSGASPSQVSASRELSGAASDDASDEELDTKELDPKELDPKERAMWQLLLREQAEQLQEAAKGLMMAVIRTLMSHQDYADTFGAPVWKQFPEVPKDFYIQEVAPNGPMDLGTIRDRVKRGHYPASQEGVALFKADLTLIATNCLKFNKPEEQGGQKSDQEPNEYVELAQQLLREIDWQCEGLWEGILERAQKQGRRQWVA